jgi:hypothetical protein
MIETYKRQDGEALGAKKAGEGSGESDIPKPLKTHHKNAFVPKPNHLRNRLDTTPAPPVFPPQTDNFQKPIKFKSVLRNEFFGKKGEKPSEEKPSEEKPSEEKPETKENPKPKPKLKPFHCKHCGRDGHLAEFCFRRKREERLAKELANKDKYRPSRGVPEPRLVPRGEGVVRTIYPRERHEFVPRGEAPHREGGKRVGFGRGEFAGRSFARGQYEYGGAIVALGPRGATVHGLPFVVRVVLQGGEWVFHLGEIGWILLTPHLSKWRGTGLIPFVLTPVLSLLLTLALVFYFAGGRHGGLWLIDSSCSRHMTGDRRWFSSLTLVMTKEYITFGDNRKGRVLSVGTVKVSESVTLQRVSLVRSLGYNLLSVSQLLDEGFEVRFKTGCSRVLDSRGDLVCTIVPEGQIFRADFSQCVGSSRCLVVGVSAELWKWHRRLGHLSFDLLSCLSGLGLV